VGWLREAKIDPSRDGIGMTIQMIQNTKTDDCTKHENKKRAIVVTEASLVLSSRCRLKREACLPAGRDLSSLRSLEAKDLSRNMEEIDFCRDDNTK
jgi:hypothetical protein